MSDHLVEGTEDLTNEPAEDSVWEVADDPLEETQELEVNEGGDSQEPAQEPKQESSDNWKAQWESTGDPSHLPEELQTVHKDMVRGMNMKFRELAEEKRAYQDARTDLQNGVEPTEEQPTGSEAPKIDDTSDEAFEQSVAKRVDWEVNQKLAGQQQQMQQQVQQLSDAQAIQRAQDYGNSKYEEISQKEGFTPEVENRMVELVTTEDFWANSLTSEQGISALFDKAVADTGGASKTPGQYRGVSRPSSQRTSKNASPASRYANSFEEMAQEAADELGIDL